MKCGISVFEHNKSIFHLGQCHSCYQSNVINEDIEKQIADKEKERLYWQQRCLAAEDVIKEQPFTPANEKFYWNFMAAKERWQQLKDQKPKEE